MLNQTNLTPIIYPSGYIEKICLNYINQINFMFIKIAILNLFYFLILRRIFYKIPTLKFKYFHIDLSEVLETVILLGNVSIIAYFLIFNYNALVFENLDIIWFIVKIIVFIIIILFLLSNKEKLKLLWEYLKNNYKE